MQFLGFDALGTASMRNVLPDVLHQGKSEFFASQSSEYQSIYKQLAEHVHANASDVYAKFYELYLNVPTLDASSISEFASATVSVRDTVIQPWRLVSDRNMGQKGNIEQLTPYDIFSEAAFALYATSEIQLDAQNHDLISETVTRFKNISEVNSIYYSVSDDTVRFFVFTNEEVYNDELMDRLIDAELELAQSYPDKKQIFEFVASCLMSDPRFVTDAHSTQIFAR